MKQTSDLRPRTELRVLRRQTDQYEEMLRKPYNWKKWMIFKYHFRDQIEETLDHVTYKKIQWPLRRERDALWENAVWPPWLSAITYKRNHDKQHAAGARCTLRKMQSGPRGEMPLFTNEITTSNKSRCNKAHCGRGAVSLGTLLRKLWLKEESIWLASQ